MSRTRHPAPPASLGTDDTSILFDHSVLLGPIKGDKSDVMSRACKLPYLKELTSLPSLPSLVRCFITEPQHVGQWTPS